MFWLAVSRRCLYTYLFALDFLFSCLCNTYMYVHVFHQASRFSFCFVFEHFVLTQTMVFKVTRTRFVNLFYKKPFMELFWFQLHCLGKLKTILVYILFSRKCWNFLFLIPLICIISHKYRPVRIANCIYQTKPHSYSSCSFPSDVKVKILNLMLCNIVRQSILLVICHSGKNLSQKLPSKSYTHAGFTVLCLT